MKKVIIIIIAAIIMVTGILSSTKSTPQMAETVKDETTKGDIVELQGKALFYKDKYGEYPVFMDNIYDMSDSDVVWATQVFENFFAKSNQKKDMIRGNEHDLEYYLEESKTYIEEHIKLIDLAEMKSKGVTYELANKKSKYYLDLLTGMVLSPELIESGDEEYINDLEVNDGLYKPLSKNPIKIQDSNNTALEISKVNGTFRSGSNIYFYGKGTMVLAVRNELTNVIKDAGEHLVNQANIEEILYIQSSTGKAAVIDRSEGIKIQYIDIER